MLSVVLAHRNYMNMVREITIQENIKNIKREKEAKEKKEAKDKKNICCHVFLNKRV